MFLSAFAQVSLAVQTALRERVPASYFEDIGKFRDSKTAYPMLVYQASRPFRGKLRMELTYDVLNPRTLATLFRTVKQPLLELLDRTEANLRANAFHDVAGQYQSRRVADILQFVQMSSKSRKCLYGLIRAEGVLVNALVDLSGLGDLLPRPRARKAALFEKRWKFQLRRLYPGTDCTWLAPVLLDSASQSLASSLVPQALVVDVESVTG